MSPSRRTAVVAALLLGAAATRLLPHPPNVTPIVAMALFGGAHLGDRRLAVLLPLGAMLLSDLVLGFHVLQPVVYLLIALFALLGKRFLGRPGAPRLAAAAIGSSVLFFLVTNLAVWALQDLYPKTPAGLSAAFVAALPFFRNTLLGDLGYAVILFGGFALAGRRLPALQRAADAGR
ncbi:MAG: DUF6580 family putative transport protein [Candidatus Polarisedimenticolia bacterium]